MSLKAENDTDSHKKTDGDRRTEKLLKQGRTKKKESKNSQTEVSLLKAADEWRNSNVASDVGMTERERENR